MDPYKLIVFNEYYSTPQITKKFLYPISQFYNYKDDNQKIIRQHLTKDDDDDNKNYFSSYGEILNEIKKGNLYCELPPEFFFMQEIFSDWVEFPKYAPNAASFMLKNLTALESEEVSLTLHKTAINLYSEKIKRIAVGEIMLKWVNFDKMLYSTVDELQNMWYPEL